MATITLDIPNDKIARITAAFGAEFGYSATLPDGSANPQSLNAFTKAKVIEYVKQVTRNYEGNLAAGTARQTTEADVNNIAIT